MAAPGGRFAAGGEAQGEARAVTAADEDPELAEVADAWPTLPRAVRAGVLAMVRASAWLT